MQDVRLTPTSFIVLGLVEQLGEATPYDLKRAVGVSVGHFWSLQHAQLYSEPDRLTGAGHLTVELEQGGRRRKRYRITASGRKALALWRDEPPEDLGELREPALLKLFFGADPARLAESQIEAHRARLARYEAIRRDLPELMTKGNALALGSGIGHELEWIRFWEEIADARGEE